MEAAAAAEVALASAAKPAAEMALCKDYGSSRRCRNSVGQVKVANNMRTTSAADAVAKALADLGADVKDAV